VRGGVQPCIGGLGGDHVARELVAVLDVDGLAGLEGDGAPLERERLLDLADQVGLDAREALAPAGLAPEVVGVEVAVEFAAHAAEQVQVELDGDGVVVGVEEDLREGAKVRLVLQPKKGEERKSGAPDEKAGGKNF